MLYLLPQDLKRTVIQHVIRQSTSQVLLQYYYRTAQYLVRATMFQEILFKKKILVSVKLYSVLVELCVHIK